MMVYSLRTWGVGSVLKKAKVKEEMRSLGSLL